MAPRIRISQLLPCMSIVLLSLAACGQQVISSASSARQQATFSAPIDRGALDNPDIVEASGIVASRKNANALWTHNDSGGAPEVYLISDRGKMLATYVLAGVKSRDWEDIAIGPGPVAGETYVYVGEIGDNNARHPVKTIYRFIEPMADEPQANAPQTDESTTIDTIRQIDAIRVMYPDGARDAETLLVDPLTKDLYIISKRERLVNIYRSAFPQSIDSLNALEKLGQLPREQVGILEQLVGGDISADGKEVLLKSYVQVFYWQREDEQTSLVDLLQTKPKVLPYVPEPQGEAIAFAADGSGYFTLSEQQSGIEPRLYFYARKEEK